MLIWPAILLAMSIALFAAVPLFWSDCKGGNARLFDAATGLPAFSNTTNSCCCCLTCSDCTDARIPPYVTVEFSGVVNGWYCTICNDLNTTTYELQCMPIDACKYEATFTPAVCNYWTIRYTLKVVSPGDGNHVKVFDKANESTHYGNFWKAQTYPVDCAAAVTLNYDSQASASQCDFSGATSTVTPHCNPV